MSIFVIWIDREHAKLFQFSNEKMERRTLESDRTGPQRTFFELLIDSLRGASKILILGPGVAKHHFQNHLLEHFPLLARKVVACETLVHPTDLQIATLAKKFFASSDKASSFVKTT